MRRYVANHSPFARMTRIMVHETGLRASVEQIVAELRVKDSAYYNINPSGRVPYLIREDGVGFEDSDLICSYFDKIAETSIWSIPDNKEGWELRRLAALARSFTDGVSVWFRETMRPEDEQSKSIINHERQRSRRLADLWEKEIGSPLMQGPLNRAQIIMVCGLGLEEWVQGFNWRDGHPKLTSWMDRISGQPSMIATNRSNT
ncbi:MAG: hypothetical protein CMF70_01665 [Magnetovibrio sp.]|nr:hypothetical protein [Magnetovibrio sp.]